MESHEQSFVKGMVSDFSDKVPDSFQDSFGIQLISDQDNTYAIETSKGNIVTFSVTKNYRPIGWIEMTDGISIKSAYAGGLNMRNGEIGYVNISIVSQSGSYIPIYNHQNLTFLLQHQTEEFVMPENDNIKRTYWTDFFNRPRAINLLAKVYHTHITNLIPGKQYMVLGGPVNHAGIIYGPNEQVGTVFTAVATGFTLPVGSTGFVIEYVPYETLDWNTRFLQSQLRLKQWIPGNLAYGSNQYFYQLITNDGAATPWSMGTRPIMIAGPPNPGGGVAQYQQMQGHPSSGNSLQGVRLILENIDPIYTRIRIAVIRNTDLNVADQPGVIIDESVTGNTMEFDHVSSSVLLPMLIDDITKIYENILKVKSLKTTNLVNFIGNIETAPDFEFNPDKTAKISHCYYDLLSDNITYGNIISLGSTVVGSGPPAGSLTGAGATISSIQSGSIRGRQFYKVYGSTGSSITYPGTGLTYGPGEVFQAVDGFKNFTAAGNATIKVIFRIQQYSGKFLEIPVEDDFYDFKGITASNYLRGYHGQETYRLGWLWFDTVGNPMFVRFLGDKTVPKRNKASTDIDPDTGQPIGFDTYLGFQHGNLDGSGDYLVRTIGMMVDNVDIKEVTNYLGIALNDLPKHVSGFSIVRARCDSQVVAQGLLFPTTTDNNTVWPVGPDRLFYDMHFNQTLFANGLRKKNIYAVYSPELNFRYNAIGGFLTTDQLEIVDYLRDDNSPSFDGYQESANFHMANRYYNRMSNIGQSTPRELRVNILPPKCRFYESGEINVVFASNLAFDNSSHTNGLLPVSPGTDRKCKGSRTLIVEVDADESGADPNFVFGYGNHFNLEPSKPLVNYIRPKAVLYGGKSKAALANTLYIGTGHYQPLDNDFMTYLINNNGIVNGIQVYGGDTFVNIFDIARMVKDNQDPDPQISFGTIFPCESRINVSLRQGRHLSKDRSYESSTGGNGLSYDNPIQPESWQYNEAYTADDAGRNFIALPNNYQPNNKSPYLIRFSGFKVPGELIDNYRKFEPNSFRYVGGRHGSITGLMEEVNRVYYVQEDAAGSVPVQERVTTSSDIGEPTTIGVGGVAVRYDERTSFMGCQHQWSICKFDGGFAWYDAKRNCPVIMTTGMELVDLAPMEGLLSFFNNTIKGDILIKDNPVLGIGILFVYDARFKRLLMTFKGVGSNRQFHWQDDFTIVYNVLHKQFQGRYKFAPSLMIQYGEYVYASPHYRNVAIRFNTPYAVEDVINEGESEYVCILAYTSSSPVIPASGDPLHWALINKKSEVYVHNKGDLQKWFGKVEKTSIKFRVNMHPELEKIFDRWRFRTNNQNFFDTITTSTSQKSGKDSNIIKSNNPEYEFRNKGWHANIPLSDDGEQMQDYWMEVLLEKDNKLNGSPIDSSNELITLLSIKTWFRKAY